MSSEETNIDSPLELKDGDSVFIDPKTGERKVNQTPEPELADLPRRPATPPTQGLRIDRAFRIQIAATIAGDLMIDKTLEDAVIVERAFKIADLLIVRGQR